MRKKIEYKSALAHHITGFIDEKQALGYSYYNGSKVMRLFDEYWIAHGYGDTSLTVENLADWIQKSDTEGAGALLDRISVVKQFSIYLNGLCIPSYIPPMVVRYERPLPHLLTKPEIKDLFTQIDTRISKSHFKDRRMADEYPVLFRLIYLNGMRISEACRLPVSQVDLDSGTITILDGKGNKDRLIYLADDMRQLCVEYLGHLQDLLGETPRWFFPGRNSEHPIATVTVTHMFNTLWAQTAFAASCDNKPTVHDLRHTYVVNRINLWMEQGLDFEHMLPYLSKFLGHKSFNETFYYYHYAEEAAKTIRKMDKVIDKVIPEVMRR